MDLDEEIKSREDRELGSESREMGDLLPCSSPLRPVSKCTLIKTISVFLNTLCQFWGNFFRLSNLVTTKPHVEGN